MTSRLMRNGLIIGAATLAFGIGSARAASDPKTVRLWKAKCASCHGEDGKAATEQGKKQGVADMTTAAWQKEWTNEKMEKATLEGLKRDKDGKKQEMEGYKDKLKPEQVKALVDHMRAFGAK